MFTESEISPQFAIEYCFSPVNIWLKIRCWNVTAARGPVWRRQWSAPYYICEFTYASCCAARCVNATIDIHGINTCRAAMHSNAQHVCELFFIQHIIWFTIINLIAGETYVHVRHVDVISCQIFFVLCYCQGVFKNSTRKHEQRHRTAPEPTRLLLTKIRKKTLKRRHLSCKVHAPFIFAMLSPPCIIPQSYDRFSMWLADKIWIWMRRRLAAQQLSDTRTTTPRRQRNDNASVFRLLPVSVRSRCMTSGFDFQHGLCY